MKKQLTPKRPKSPKSPIQVQDLAPADLEQVVGGQAPQEERRK